MKSYTEKLRKELLTKLDELNRNYDPLNLMDCRLQLIADAIDQIKEKLKKYSFKKQEEEIYYFKKALPNFLSLYFYYQDKMEWDRIAQLGSNSSQYKYHDRIFLQAENFRSENLFFYNYCRGGRMDGDDVYFIKTTTINKERNYQPRMIIDPSTPPLYCELMAKYIAYSRLEFESKKFISENNKTSNPIGAGRKTLYWTGKQIDLIEIGYALKEMGVFNHGEATLTDIFDCFEEAFNVDPGNTSRLFQDITRRKSGVTLFLDMMKIRLVQRIDAFLN
jgi:RteC protein